MKKIFASAMLATMLIFGNSLPAQAASLYEIPGIMVLAYVDKSANLKADDLSKPINFSFISEFVEEFLPDTHRFRLVEREHQPEVLNEIAGQMNNTVNADTITQAGKYLGAAYPIAGSITGISPKESGVSYENSTAGGGHFNKRAIEANVTIRIIDVKIEDYYETTTTDENGIETMSEGKSADCLQYEVKIGSEKFTQAQVGNAIRKAIEDAIKNKRHGLLAKIDGTGTARKV